MHHFVCDRFYIRTISLFGHHLHSKSIRWPYLSFTVIVKILSMFFATFHTRPWTKYLLFIMKWTIYTNILLLLLPQYNNNNNNILVFWYLCVFHLSISLFKWTKMIIIFPITIQNKCNAHKDLLFRLDLTYYRHLVKG